MPPEQMTYSDTDIEKSLADMGLKLGDKITLRVNAYGSPMWQPSESSIPGGYPNMGEFTVVGTHHEPGRNYLLIENDSSGWGKSNEGNFKNSRLHSKFNTAKRFMYVNPKAIPPQADIKKYENNARIEKEVKGFGFSLGEKIDYVIEGKHYAGVVVGSDGPHLLIKFDEKQGFAWDADSNIQGNNLHSKFDHFKNNFYYVIPRQCNSQKNMAATVKKVPLPPPVVPPRPAPREVFGVNGRTFTVGDVHYVIAAGSPGLEQIISHRETDRFRKMTEIIPQTEFYWKRVTIKGKSITPGYVDVSYVDRTGLVKDFSIPEDAVYAKDTKMAEEVFQLNREVQLREAGYKIGDEVKIVTINLSSAKHIDQTSFEGVEGLIDHIEKEGGSFGWTTATIKALSKHSSTTVEVEYLNDFSNAVVEEVPLHAVYNKSVKAPDEFAASMERTALAKLGYKIGDKVKFIAVKSPSHTGNSKLIWKDDFYTGLKLSDPEWVEGLVHGADGKEIKVHYNGASAGFPGWEDTVSFKPELLFSIDTTEFPDDVKKLVPTIKKVKKEFVSAGYRVAANQLTKLAHKTIISVLSKQEKDESKLQAFVNMLDSEIGKAMIGGTIGLILLRFHPNDPRAIRLAEEFRINSMAMVGNEIIDTFTSEVLPGLIQAFSALPEEDKTRILTETKTEMEEILSEEDVEETTTQKMASK